MRHPRYKSTVAALVVGTLGAAPTLAGQPDPYEKPDNTWISISGVVQSVTRDAFNLDYGDGLVIVEMDDEGYQQIDVGDTVRAIGTIDDELFDDQELKAASVVTLVD